MVTDGAVVMATPPLQKHLNRLQVEVAGRESESPRDVEGIAESDASVAR